MYSALQVTGALDPRAIALAFSLASLDGQNKTIPIHYRGVNLIAKGALLKAGETEKRCDRHTAQPQSSHTPAARLSGS